LAGHDRITQQGKQFYRQINELKKMQVRVGFQRGYASSEGSADIVDIAAWNELGTAKVPSRPFLRQSTDKNRVRISAMCKAQLQAIARGEATAESALNAIGAMQVGLVQNEIRNGEFVPNAPSTIAKKKSDQPLIDSGTMRQSVKHVIKPKGGD